MSLSQLLGVSTANAGNEDFRTVVVLTEGELCTAVCVDASLGKQEIVIKLLEHNFSHVKGVMGVTILSNGESALVIDIPAIMRKIG